MCSCSEHVENLPDPSVDILAGLFSVYVAHGIEGEHGNKRTSPADEERVKIGAPRRAQILWVHYGVARGRQNFH